MEFWRKIFGHKSQELLTFLQNERPICTVINNDVDGRVEMMRSNQPIRDLIDYMVMSLERIRETLIIHQASLIETTREELLNDPWKIGCRKEDIPCDHQHQQAAGFIDQEFVNFFTNRQHDINDEQPTLKDTAELLTNINKAKKELDEELITLYRIKTNKHESLNGNFGALEHFLSCISDFIILRDHKRLVEYLPESLPSGDSLEYAGHTTFEAEHSVHPKAWFREALESWRPIAEEIRQELARLNDKSQYRS